MKKSYSFTLRSNGYLNILKTEALILSKVRRKNTEYTPKMWTSIWDTGASTSCINKKIVDDLNLIPVGKKTISTANGITEALTYLVDIGLPNQLTISNILVSCADLGNDTDILIGMDIIKYGDFAISNLNGKTTFSFRIPSLEERDFCK